MAKHPNELYFDRALKDGILVHVDTVPNGLACGCICPECETPLVAYNNEKNKKAHHFQHHSKTDCRNYYETMLHYLAKQIIQETKKLRVPDTTYTLSDYARGYFDPDWINNTEKPISGSRMLVFDSVELERHISGITPDVICKIGDRTLYIEIAVTHFVDHVKKEKIRNLGVATLEIDLSKINRSLQQEELRKALSGSVQLMSWIYNPAIEKRKEKHLERIDEMRSLLKENTILLKAYGKNQRVYNCPIIQKDYEVDKWNCDNCKYLVGEVEKFDFKPEIDDERPYQPQLYIKCAGKVAKGFLTLLDRYGVTYKDNKAFGK